jgi:hypothetical protein
MIPEFPQLKQKLDSFFLFRQRYEVNTNETLKRAMNEKTISNTNTPSENEDTLKTFKMNAKDEVCKFFKEIFAYKLIHDDLKSEFFAELIVYMINRDEKNILSGLILIKSYDMGNLSDFTRKIRESCDQKNEIEKLRKNSLPVEKLILLDLSEQIAQGKIKNKILKSYLDF